MAITQVQSTELGCYGDQVGYATITFSAPITTGNLIVIQLSHDTESGTITGVSDGTNTYAHATGANSTGPTRNTDIYYKENCVGGPTVVTVTLSGPYDSASQCIISAAEYYGAKTSGSFDTASAFNGNSTITGPTITPSATGELLVCVLSNGEVNITGVDSPWTLDQIETAGHGGFGTGYQINAALSAQNCAFQPTGSYDCSSSTASFLAASTVTDNGRMFLVF
jgi:hypothetical protein